MGSVGERKLKGAATRNAHFETTSSLDPIKNAQDQFDPNLALAAKRTTKGKVTRSRHSDLKQGKRDWISSKNRVLRSTILSGSNKVLSSPHYLQPRTPGSKEERKRHGLFISSKDCGLPTERRLGGRTFSLLGFRDSRVKGMLCLLSSIKNGALLLV